MNGKHFWKSMTDMQDGIFALHVRGGAPTARNRDMLQRFRGDANRMFRRLREAARQGRAQRRQFCEYVSEFVIANLYELFLDSRDEDLLHAVDQIFAKAHLVRDPQADLDLLQQQLYQYGALVEDHTALTTIMFETWKCRGETAPQLMTAELAIDRESYTDSGGVVVETAS